MYSLDSSSSSIVAAMPRFSNTGLRTAPKLAQQVEVLHVPRAHLKAIDVRQHRFDLRDLHDLADHQKTVCPCRIVHQLQPWNPHALEGIRRTARLVSSSAQKAPRPPLLRACRLEQSALRFSIEHGPAITTTCFAAQLHAVGKFNHRAFRPKSSTRQFIGRADAMYVKHTRQTSNLFRSSGRRTHASQNGLGCAGRPVNTDTCLHHCLDYEIDLLFGGHAPALQRSLSSSLSSARLPDPRRQFLCARPWPGDQPVAGACFEGIPLRCQLVPLQCSHHVDDALVDMRQLDVGKRPFVCRAHVRVDHLLACRLIYRQRGRHLQ